MYMYMYMHIYSDTTRKLTCRLKMDLVKRNFHLNQRSIFRFFYVSIQRGIYLSIHIFVEVPVLEVSPFTPEASIVCSSYLMPGSIVKLQPMLPGIVKWMCLEHISQLGASLLFAFRFINTWIFLFLRFLKSTSTTNTIENWNIRNTWNSRVRMLWLVFCYTKNCQFPFVMMLRRYVLQKWRHGNGDVIWCFRPSNLPLKKTHVVGISRRGGKIFQDSIFLHQQKNSQHFRVASCDMISHHPWCGNR